MLCQNLHNTKEEIKDGGRKKETTVQKTKSILVDCGDQKGIKQNAKNGAEQAGKPEDISKREFVVSNCLSFAVQLKMEIR